MATERHLRAIDGNRDEPGRLRRAPLPAVPEPGEMLSSGWARLTALGEDAARAVVEHGPGALLALASDVDRGLAALPLETNEIGRDRFGFSPTAARHPLYLGAFLYRFWFRAEVEGQEHLPAGRCVVVANHGGQLPFDAWMLQMACLLDGQPPRLPRILHPRSWAGTPVLAAASARLGGQAFTQHNARRLLAADEAITVFPEGPVALGKPLRHRYRLEPFSGGFVRAAVAAGAPIVPAAIVGSEEQIPAITSFPALAERLGIPALPITPAFPLLGPAGLVPLPVRYRIRFGPPLRIRGDADDPADAFERRAATVRTEVETLLDRVLEQRDTIF